jgi:two-component system, NarL family, nitrate/nitrite response regulator NarL
MSEQTHRLQPGERERLPCPEPELTWKPTLKRAVVASVREMGEGVDEGVLSVIIIDDHTLFAGGLQLLLESATGGRITVVGKASRASEAEELVRRHRPDLAIVDLAMPPPGGAEAIRAIKRRYPQVRVLALSGVDSAEMALAALVAGADGFVPKSAEPEVVLVPMQAVMEGWGIVSRQLLDYLVTRAARSGSAALERLSEEERTLWRMVATGLETMAIAEQLYVSERTAKRLVASLLRKIGASNRLEAAALAGRAGLLEDRND